MWKQLIIWWTDNTGQPERGQIIKMSDDTNAVLVRSSMTGKEQWVDLPLCTSVSLQNVDA